MYLIQYLIRCYGQFKTWIQVITFYEIAVGMQSTLRHLLHYKPITIQYPQKRLLPENYRGMLALLRYDNGTEKCVDCDLYETAHPSHVINVLSAKVPDELIKRHDKSYTMDMTRCLVCGLCVQVCSVDALAMTREYEWAVYNKQDLLLNKDQLLAIGDRSFESREKRLESQHPNVAYFNIAFPGQPLQVLHQMARSC